MSRPGPALRGADPGEDDLLFYALCTPRFRWAAYEDVEAPVSARQQRRD